MKMQKRGISPLIATVLIVGFTIALAAIVINWGQNLTRQVQEETETVSKQQITCSTDVVFDLSSACDNGANSVKVVVKNNGVRDIDSFLARSYRDEDDVEQDTLNFGGNGIPSFGIESGTYSVDSEPIKLVEFIPIITISGSSVTCAANIQSFGDLDGAGLVAC